MKKYIAAVMALAACIALCACGRTTSESSASSETETSIAAETSAADAKSAADGWNGTFIGADGNMTLKISAVGNNADIKISTSTGNEITLKADVSGSAASADYEGVNIAFALSGDGKQITVASVFDDVSGTYEKTDAPEAGANNLFGSSESSTAPAEDNGWFGTYYCSDSEEYLVIGVDKFDSNGMEFNFSGGSNYYTNIFEQGDTENNLFISADKDISLGRMSTGNITVLSTTNPALSGTYKPADPSTVNNIPSISIEIAPQETTAKPAETTKPAVTTKPAATTTKPAATTAKPTAATGKVNVLNKVGTFYCAFNNCSFIISADEYADLGCSFSMTDNDKKNYSTSNAQYESDNTVSLSIRGDITVVFNADGSITVTDNSSKTGGIYTGTYKPQ